MKAVVPDVSRSTYGVILRRSDLKRILEIVGSGALLHCRDYEEVAIEDLDKVPLRSLRPFVIHHAGLKVTLYADALTTKCSADDIVARGKSDAINQMASGRSKAMANAIGHNGGFIALIGGVANCAASFYFAAHDQWMHVLLAWAMYAALGGLCLSRIWTGIEVEDDQAIPWNKTKVGIVVFWLVPLVIVALIQALVRKFIG